MTVYYGFYNSLAGDRLYDAIDVSKLLEGVIEDGVFPSIGEKLATVAAGGMIVNVSTGRAWFENTWTYNDAACPLTVEAADPTYPRIDTVALEVNPETLVRANTLMIKKGTPGSDPQPPLLTKTKGGINQHGLAYIYVDAGVTSIIQANITNKVGSIICPWVSGPLSVVKTNELVYLGVFWPNEAVTVGDGQYYMPVPPFLAGSIVDFDIAVVVPSTNGLPTVQMANCGGDPSQTGTDILSTRATIDLNEQTSLTAAAQPVIAYPAIAAGDWLRIDVDVAGTGTYGLVIFFTVEKLS